MPPSRRDAELGKVLGEQRWPGRLCLAMSAGWGASAGGFLRAWQSSQELYSRVHSDDSSSSLKAHLPVGHGLRTLHTQGCPSRRHDTPILPMGLQESQQLGAARGTSERSRDSAPCLTPKTVISKGGFEHLSRGKEPDEKQAAWRACPVTWECLKGPVEPGEAGSAFHLASSIHSP